MKKEIVENEIIPICSDIVPSVTSKPGAGDITTTATPKPEGGKERTQTVNRTQAVEYFLYNEEPGNIWFHGSRSPEPLSFSRGGHEGSRGLYLSKKAIYARPYAFKKDPAHVYMMQIKPKSKAFYTNNSRDTGRLAKWLKEAYPTEWNYASKEGVATDLRVPDLQSNSIYDHYQVQEGLFELGYEVVFNGAKTEALILDAEKSAVVVNEYRIPIVKEETDLILKSTEAQSPDPSKMGVEQYREYRFGLLSDKEKAQTLQKGELQSLTAQWDKEYESLPNQSRPQEGGRVSTPTEKPALPPKSEPPIKTEAVTADGKKAEQAVIPGASPIPTDQKNVGMIRG